MQNAYQSMRLGVISMENDDQIMINSFISVRQGRTQGVQKGGGG
jgi:hypothetical protein